MKVKLLKPPIGFSEDAEFREPNDGEWHICNENEKPHIGYGSCDMAIVLKEDGTMPDSVKLANIVVDLFERQECPGYDDEKLARKIIAAHAKTKATARKKTTARKRAAK